MQAKHTPGPWLRDSGGKYAEIVCALSPRGRVITVARIASGVKTRAPDASLIAAAPALLAAATRFMAASFPPDHADTVFDAELAEYAAAWRDLTAAIAKATGAA